MSFKIARPHGRRPATLPRQIRRALASSLSSSLVSVAGLIGRPVRHQSGLDLGRVRDIVIRWESGPHPAVAGVVVKVGNRTAYIATAAVESITTSGVNLRSATVDLRDFVPRDGEVALAQHILDHQLVDIDGVRIVRASDLYLADVAGAMRLVGVDVGAQTLLRRLGPARYRSVATPTKVIDWATIQPLTPGSSVRLTSPNQGLQRLRPAELADLLEDLARPQRQQLLDALEPEQAADALEEMDDEEREAVLRNATPTQAAGFVAGMAPDEAAEVLRDLDDDDRQDILDALPDDARQELSLILSFPDNSAGAAMTTTLVAIHKSDTVDTAIGRLAELRADRADIDAILVIDQDGTLIDDITLFELLLADRHQQIGELVGDPYPMTVYANDELHTVVERFIDNRGSSIVVVDDHNHPLGRILADDVIDALLEAGPFARARRNAS